MTPLCLRFVDKVEADEVLADSPPIERDDIGVITNEVDGELVELPGWHVNVLVDGDPPPEALQPFTVTPAHPRRRFAGY